MMKNAFFYFLLLLCFAGDLRAQKDFEPQILILSPGKSTCDPALKNEMSRYDQQLKDQEQYKKGLGYLETPEFKGQPANVQQVIRAEIEYSKNTGFVKQLSSMAEQFLLYKFFEGFPNLMIRLKDTTVGGKMEDLRRLSASSGLQYVLYFPAVSFYREQGISFAKLSAQFYDAKTNALLIDTTYTGDWDNPGFEFACEDSTLFCTVSNALAPLLNRVINLVIANSPSVKEGRDLWVDRLVVIDKEYYRKPFDKSFLPAIIPSTDSSINLKNVYQLLVSDDRSKFVGFFITRKEVKGLRGLNENNTDKNVRILTDRDIRDSGYLNDIPQAVGYIVKGVKYKGKWYYEKAEVTYFTPEDDEEGRLQYLNNLQDWGFFKDGSVELSPAFWETRLFAKVKDLRKDPDWEKYGATIWKADEEENRPYIGLYEIVAEQLKGKKKEGPKRISVN